MAKVSPIAGNCEGLKALAFLALSALWLSVYSYQKYSESGIKAQALLVAVVLVWAVWWCESAAPPCPYRRRAMPAKL